MRPGVLLVATVLLVTGGGTAALARDADLTASPASGAVLDLPSVGVAGAPLCPGPQTLLAPTGGRSVPAPGPVLVAAGVLDAADAPAASSGLSVEAGAADAEVQAPGELDGIRLYPVGSGLNLITLGRTTASGVRLETPRGAAPSALAAVQVSVGRSGELRGLAAQSCAAAGTDSWLLGGGTQPGRRGRLILTNPAATAAVVDVIVHGPTGVVPAPSGTGVVVPEHGQVALLVDALAPGLETVAVQVQARTGRVAASLHDSYLRGLVPGGVDDVTPAAAASRRQVVPGVSVQPGVGQTLPARAGDPGAVAVRVVNPGRAEAVVRVRLLGPGGGRAVARSVRLVPAGAVVDVVVTQVPAGTYAAVVEADNDVLASALVGRSAPAGATRGPAEFGWASSAQVLTDSTLVTLPAAPIGTPRAIPVRSVLTLAAARGAGSARVVELDAAGKILTDRVSSVAASTTTEQPLAASTAAVLVSPVAGAGPLVGALVLDLADPAGAMISVIPLRPGTGAGTEQRLAVHDPAVGLR